MIDTLSQNSTFQNFRNKGHMKLWIDTDAGVDDAMAILLALACPTVEVIGISCLTGNAHCSSVVRNVNRVLHLFGNCSHIPIFAGCDRALLEAPMVIPEIHGTDGLGDISDSDFGLTDIPIRQSPDHAVTGLIAAASLHGAALTVLTLGPLTNVAIALRMAPAAVLSVGHVVIMGGAEDGVGNTSQWAEFNFRCDPEAAQIVLSGFPPEKTTIASWTLTALYGKTGDEVEEFMGRTATVLGRFIRESWKVMLAFNNGILYMPDPFAAFITCYGERAVKAARRMKMFVVRHGEQIGMSVAEDVEQGGIQVVTEIDWELYRQVAFAMMDHH
jgi:purine nucleosidase